MPNAASRPVGSPYNLTDSTLISGTDTGAGQITRSAEGLFLMVSGYNGINGDANIAISDANVVNRTLGILDGTATMYTPIAYNNIASGGTYRSLASDGHTFWAATSSMILFTDFSSATQLTAAGKGDSRVVNIFNHTLFASTQSPDFNGTGSNSNLGIWQIGTLGTLPTTGTPALVNIINTGTGSTPSAFQFNTAMTVAYVADDRSSSSGGIQKWTSNGAGTWSLQYTLSTGVANIGARGLTVDWSNPSAPVLYGTSAEASNNRLFKVTDTGAGSAATTLASAGANKAFRGVDFALLPSAWTSSTSGNWSTTTATTYNSTVGSTVPKYGNWTTGLERSEAHV